MKNFKLILKSLINNAACVEGGRHRPWFFAVIIAVLSLAVAIVPTFVQSITRQGDQLVSNAEYGVQVASQRFIEDMNDNGINLVIEAGDSSNILDITQAKQEFEKLANEGKNNPAHNSDFRKDLSGNICWTHFNSEYTIDLQVYILSDEEYRDNNIIQSISSYKTEEDGKTVLNKRVGSFMILTPTYAALYVQKNSKGTLSDVGSIYGDFSYIDTKDGPFSLNSFNGYKTSAQLAVDYPATDLESGAKYAEYRESTWNNWKLFYKTFYNNTRLTNTWQSTLLILAIDAALLLFMGLMIWILTRGKNNPFRIYTFWESQKIAYWTAITPALLTCGLSFLITSFSQVFFALFIGVRVMWLSMRTLRPDAVAPSQSNYSKNVKTVNTKPIKNK